METARCRAFLTAAETGSFSKAAEVLNYTPSGVSQLVTALENELGFLLLRRSQKGVSPTENGTMLLPAVREFLLQENRICQMAAEVNGLSTGSVTIAAYSSIATHWLPAVIRSFQEDYPQIHIKLMEGIRQDVSKWLDDKAADIAFFSYQDPMPYDWIPLAEDPMLAVLPKDHPLASSDAYPLRECEHEKFIMPALGCDNDVVAMLEKNHLTLNICFSTLGDYAAMAMIEQGLGMSIMNSLITKNWNCDVVKLPLNPPQQITMGIAVPSLEKASPAVAKFLKYAVRDLSCGGADPC
jgi:DNA-binding transcriptional LysR family regulator